MARAGRTSGPRRPRLTAAERATHERLWPRSRPGHKVVGGEHLETLVAKVLSAVLSGVSVGDINRIYGVCPATTTRWLAGWGITGVPRKRTRTVYYDGYGPEPSGEYVLLWCGD